MDKRLYLAFLLTALVVFATPLLFQSRPATRTGAGARDTERASTVRSDSALRESAERDLGSRTPPPAGVQAPLPGSRAVLPAETRGDGEELGAGATDAATIVVRSPKVTYRLSTLGAAPVGVLLNEYRALGTDTGHVELVRPGSSLLSYRVVVGSDTLPLERTVFAVDSSGLHDGSGVLRFRAATSAGEAILTYSFAPDSYLVRVSGEVRAPGAAASGAAEGTLLITMPRGLNSQEADTLDDQRNMAYVVRSARADPRSISFGSLDPGERRVENGPLLWVASKTKYFLVVLLTPEAADAPRFTAALITGGPREGKAASRADALVVQPLTPDGQFAFELYAGPQEWRRLVALGRDLENANPYGGFMSGVVQPFATIVMRILLWMHDTLKWSYGWVLVVFGIAVRLILWPLNQTAMRSSLKMQRLQPELMEVQKKHRANPEKQREEMMRIYKAHGMSPFSPVAGCLPMLLPMPVLFALFFVFQNTIEFRGVSFLWLSDISLKDPYYILPIAMGASMYVLSWIGLRNSPPNPQAKMMAYIFPVMMTVFLLNLAAGLNLYYAVQNVAALPQQWLIARERGKAGLPAAQAAATPSRGTARGEGRA